MSELNSNIRVIELASYEAPQITESKKDDWVTFGDNNSYFQFLIDRYKNSTTNNAVINNITRLIYGRGLSALDASRKPNEYAQMMSIFNSSEIKKIVTDLKIFGQCAIQVSKSKGKVLKAFHMPVQLLAPQKCDKDGKINAYYYSDNWEDIKNFPPKAIPAFGTSKEDIEILYIKPYSVGMKYFSYCDYQGCIPYAKLEEEISDYLINEVQNGFSGTKVININSGSYTEEQQDDYSRQILNSVTGSKGKKVIVSFVRNQEQKTTIDDVPLNDAPQHYQYLSDECRNKIMVGHNVTSPLIFGITSSNGFSSNADELKNSVVLFDNMVIRPIQDLLTEAFDQILAVNGISLKLYFRTLQPLEFTDLENAQSEEQVAEETGTELSKVNTELEEIINQAEELQEGWQIVDERDVDVELEEELNLQLVNAELKLSEKGTFLSKLINLVSSGTPKPNLKSTQDKKVGDLKYFKVRYRYTGNKTPDRDFCKAMMSASTRLFRKEDIDLMSSKAVNAGFGENGANTYDIFRFKGGARCHHKWQRVTMMLDLTKMEKGYQDIGTRSAEIKGYKVTNPYEVSIYPNNLPLKGFSPKNKNLPSDVK
jgi:hypothetical protein